MRFHSTRWNVGLCRRSCGAALAAWFLLGLVGSSNAQEWQYAYDLSGNFEFRVTTNGPPRILGQPQTQIVLPGGLASFSVVMADTHGLSYQWRFNNTSLAGATSDTLLLANVSATNEGPYSVVVANSSGSVTSAPALLLFDSDEDGLPDIWEMANFGNLTSQRSLGDPDGDGISNFDEFRAGTSPTNSAAFSPRLTLTKTGSGAGTVTIVPAKSSYDLGETVTLTATPVPPSLFGGWTGSLNTNSNPVTLTMNSNRIMQARFSTAVLAPPGMIAYWRAETDASDSVGTNHGAFYRGTSVVGPSITSAGKVGSAFNFDGTNFVQVPDSAALRPAQFTAEAWVYPAVQYPLEFLGIISRRSANGLAQWVLNIYNGKPYFNSVEAPLPIPLNQWTHLAISFDGSTQRFYVNGALVASRGGLTALSYDLQASPPLYIGSDIGGGRRFNGRIDEVVLYNRALADSEIAGLYYADVAGRRLDRPSFTSPPQLPRANLGIGYTQQVIAALGTAPISFALTAGALPPGLTFSPTGVISGVPGLAGSFGFTVRATDAAAVYTEQQCTLAVFDQVTAPAGLIGWWRAETNALDSAGANHGVLSNGVTFVPGLVGQAFAFNGVNQSVDIPDAPALRPASLTLEAWVRINKSGDTVGYQFFFSKPAGSPAHHSYMLYLTPPGLLSGRVGDASGPAGDIIGGTLTTGILHHVAYTFDDASKQQILYLNGIEVASGTGIKSIGYDTNSVLLGRDHAYGAPYFTSFLNGSLDEAAIYNRALSGDEIASIYNAGVLGKSLPLPPIILRASVEAGVLLISFDAAIGQTYAIEAVHDLGLDSWSVLTNITAVSASVVFSVPITESTLRFYRVAVTGD